MHLDKLSMKDASGTCKSGLKRYVSHLEREG